MNETHTTVVGTLITPIGRRRLPDGGAVVSFRMASNERRFDRASDTWRDGDTLYLSVTAWRRLAENVHASLVVGDPIVVHGRLYSRSWEKDGRRNWVTEMDASAVGPDLSRCTTTVTRLPRRTDAAPDTAPDTGPDTAPGADRNGGAAAPPAVTSNGAIRVAGRGEPDCTEGPGDAHRCPPEFVGGPSAGADGSAGPSAELAESEDTGRRPAEAGVGT